MRLSQTGLGTIRVNNLDKSYPAQDILLQTNQLVQYGTGIYAYNNVPLKLKENVERVIKGVLDKYGCIETNVAYLCMRICDFQFFSLNL